jgi:hypothetical protein
MGEKIVNEPENSDARRGVRQTGPRTPHGKARSRFNAMKTGIFAKLVLAAKPFDESRSNFEELLADLQASIRPRDHFERVLVETLALQFLRLTRVYQTDAEVAPLLFRNVREKFESDEGDAAIAGLLNGEPSGAAKFPAADLLMRYEAGIWRQIDRIMERIQQWRRLGSERSAQPSHTSEDAHLRDADVQQAS